MFSRTNDDLEANLASAISPRIIKNDDLTRIVTKELDMAIYPQFIGREEWCVNKLLKQRKFKFNTDLNGIVIRYDDWEFLSETGRIIDDTPLIFWKIRVKFHIFNVEKDQIIKSPMTRFGSKYAGCSFFNCIDVTIKFDAELEKKIENYLHSNFNIGDTIVFKVKSFKPSQRFIEGIIDQETFDYLQELSRCDYLEE